MTHRELFFNKIATYAVLSESAKEAWNDLLQNAFYKKGADFIQAGQVPKKAAFVIKGLFSQSYLGENGEVVIKYFFPEERIAGSVSAALLQKPSDFAITALEDTQVLEYDFDQFRKLAQEHNDIAQFYIRYMEKHWIIEKEPYEVSFRNETAAVRYKDFMDKYPNLTGRLKKHQIAAYLGITPTQLSRILLDTK